jgi:uncharacterized protein YjbI with pentapeptide repeats
MAGTKKRPHWVPVLIVVAVGVGGFILAGPRVSRWVGNGIGYPPDTVRNLGVAFVGGAVVGAALLWLDERLDRRRRAEQASEAAEGERVQFRVALALRTDLRTVDVSGVDLGGMNLRNKMFERASLEGTDLTAADLRGSNFNHSYLQGVKLAGARLQGCHFEAADLTGADLRGATADTSSTFHGSTMRNADLRRADLRGCDLTNTKLIDARLEDAAIDGARFEGADLSGATFEFHIGRPANWPTDYDPRRWTQGPRPN